MHVVFLVAAEQDLKMAKDAVWLSVYVLCFILCLLFSFLRTTQYGLPSVLTSTRVHRETRVEARANRVVSGANPGTS